MPPGEPPKLQFRLLHRGEIHLLHRVAEEVFDCPVDPALAEEFLSDPRHHLAVALDGDTVVGFVSAVDYVHPDKPRQLWINEVGVAPSHQGLGAGKALLRLMIGEGRRIGCTEAWVLTDDANAPANGLYRSAGGSASEAAQRMYVFQING